MKKQILLITVMVILLTSTVLAFQPITNIFEETHAAKVERALWLDESVPVETDRESLVRATGRDWPPLQPAELDMGREAFEFVDSCKVVGRDSYLTGPRTHMMNPDLPPEQVGTMVGLHCRTGEYIDLKLCKKSFLGTFYDCRSPFEHPYKMTHSSDYLDLRSACEGGTNCFQQSWFTNELQSRRFIGYQCKTCEGGRVDYTCSSTDAVLDFADLTRPGYNINEKGITTLRRDPGDFEVKSEQDRCLSWNPDVLVEYYCGRSDVRQGKISSTMVTCEYGCEDGRCLPGPADEPQVSCSLGETKCVSGKLTTCVRDFSSLGKNTWSLPQNCPTGQSCVDGACTSSYVAQAYKSCVNGHPYWFDSLNRQGERAQTCSGNQVCQGGECVSAVEGEDIPSERKCSDGHVYWFTSDGKKLNRATTCRSNEECVEVTSAHAECRKIPLPPEEEEEIEEDDVVTPPHPSTVYIYSDGQCTPTTSPPQGMTTYDTEQECVDENMPDNRISGYVVVENQCLSTTIRADVAPPENFYSTLDECERELRTDPTQTAISIILIVLAVGFIVLFGFMDAQQRKRFFDGIFGGRKSRRFRR